jgi:hypothetical protein
VIAVCKLRFLIVDGNVGTCDGLCPEESTFDLSKLPHPVLKKILSYLSIDDVLNGLALTTKGMMGKIRGLCRVECLVLDHSLESRRMEVLASSTYVSDMCL